MANPYFNSILIIDQDIIIPIIHAQDQEPPVLETQAYSEGPDLDLTTTEACFEGGTND